jgi:hypothetical protein
MPGTEYTLAWWKLTAVSIEAQWTVAVCMRSATWHVACGLAAAVQTKTMSMEGSSSSIAGNKQSCVVAVHGETTDYMPDADTTKERVSS